VNSAHEQEPGPVRLLVEFPSTSYGNLIVRYPYQRTSDYAFAYHEAAKRPASTFEGEPPDSCQRGVSVSG
jgi:hypothetical protein